MRQIFFAVLALSFPFMTAARTSNASDANNRFAFDLYKVSSKTHGNLFFSPFSISAALAMTSAGAQQETLKQMLATLHLSPNYHPDFKTLLEQLRGNKDYQLNVANRLWGKVNKSYDPTFLKILRENYTADLQPLDFEKQPEPSRETINQWVEKQTQDKIKDLLKPEMVTSATDLVLTNAIYFKGSWVHTFDKEATKDDQFHLSSAEKKSIPFMHKTEDFRYAENSSLQYVQLPYKGYALVMDILLPKPGMQLSAIEQKLSSQSWTEFVKHAGMTEVQLSLPKFKMSSEFDLGGTLSSMGMPLAFDASKANFHGIRKLDPGENLYISKAVHKAFVDVNEEGTEAAAATAIGMTESVSIPPPPKVFKADRPFLFFIRHLNSGAILFIGRYSNP